MKEKLMNWIITQIFLSDTGVHEVYVHHSSHKLRCDCSGFSARNTCKHAKFVQSRMNDNGGVYPVQIDNSADKEASLASTDDPKAFRELLLNFGKIEAL